MATVMAGVPMLTVDEDPEVSTVGATVVEDERIGTIVQDVDRGQWDTVDIADGDDSVIVLVAVIVCVALVTVQFISDKAPSAA